MRFHWQNLNDPDREGNKRHWLHGRAWFGNWCVEWCLPSWQPSFSIAIKMPERQLAGFHACAGLLGLFLSHQWRQDCGGIRRIDFYWINGKLKFTPWSREWEWRSTDPWYVKGVSFNPADFLLGRMRHEHTIHEDWIETSVPMPEGSYPAKLRREERSWTRPRWPWWPFRIVQKYIEVELPGGIPFEGKGENSWDCGEDGLWGCSSSSWSYEKAIGHVVESVLKNRKRYGGSWIHRGREPVMAIFRGGK